MYHSIVSYKLKKVFDALNQGNYQPMMDSLAEPFNYCFEGDLSISGSRNSRQTMIAWWQRIFRLLPGMQFDVKDVVVAGWPWNTRIHTHLEVSLLLKDGAVYRNVVMQVLHMRWGKLTSILSLEDTARAARLLAHFAKEGQLEALAAPLTDLPWPLPGPFMSARLE